MSRSPRSGRGKKAGSSKVRNKISRCSGARSGKKMDGEVGEESPRSGDARSPCFPMSLSPCYPLSNPRRPSAFFSA